MLSNVMNPRLLRLRDAPGYLGMDRNKFNKDVRPYLTEIPLSPQAIAFDRLELDAWVDEYIRCNGRPGSSKGDELWDAKERQDSSVEVGSGTSTNRSVDTAFAKALAKASLRKPKNT